MGAMTNDEREELAELVEHWCAHMGYDINMSGYTEHVIMALEALGWTGPKSAD